MIRTLFLFEFQLHVILGFLSILGTIVRHHQAVKSFFLHHRVHMGNSSVTNQYLQFGTSALMTYASGHRFEISLYQ